MLFSTCVDITALASPALIFSYHMLGGAMGTLNVVINNDTAWTRSGQQDLSGTEIKLTYQRIRVL